MISRGFIVVCAAMLGVACSSGPSPTDAGGCSPACGAGAACVNGACQCNQNFTSCPTDGGSACVELLADDHNCGACGMACPGTSTCLNGVCECTGTSTRCGDGGNVCTDLSSDPLNCSACGVVCPTNEACVSDFCTCENPFTECALPDSGQACADLGTDPGNCGACGRACDPATQECQPGVGGGPGSCTCKSGTFPCDGGCVDFDTDLGNCGGCGKLCATGLCNAGVCDCSDADAGYAQCGLSCTDLQTDVNNCGSCDNDCTQIGFGLTNIGCIAGACTCGDGLESICTSPQIACVDLTSSSSHCGDCGTSCSGATTACVNGNCACPNGGELCGGLCEALDSDPANCGACFYQCASNYAQGAACHGGACACLDTQTLCLDGVGGGPPDPLNPTCTCVANTTGCVQPTLKFDTDVYPLLSQTGPLGCASCHAGANAPGGLDFTSEASAWEGLVGGDGGLYGTCDGGPTGAAGSIPSLACPCTPRVDTVNPNDSLLMEMLGKTTLCPGAEPMPLDSDGGFHALSACEIQQIAVWMSQGAQRN